MKLCFLLLLFTLFGCESTSFFSKELNEKNKPIIKDNVKSLNESLESLSEQLFLLDTFDYKNKAIGVTTFVWVDNFQTKQGDNIYKFLEYYLPNSLKVEFVQRESNVIEFQTASSLRVTDSASYYLSRDLNELSEDVYIDYVLVGSLLEIDEGVMVTVEVIDIKTKIIVAGAKEYIPTLAFHKRNDIVFKNNQIYRDSKGK